MPKHRSEDRIAVLEHLGERLRQFVAIKIAIVHARLAGEIADDL